MTRTYELGFIVEPRQSDEDVQNLAVKFSEILETAGATITHTDFWGRRKLAYPIQKLNEGKYVFLYFSSDTAPATPEVERLMRQSDKILRYLTVRTDLDIKRAMRKGKVKPKLPGADKDEATEEKSE